MEKNIIRRIEENDLKIVAKICTDAWKINYKGFISDDFLKSRTVENFIEKRKRNNWIGNNEIDTFIYEENNIVKGFISGNTLKEKYDCEIGMLYIDPNFQGNGIGTKLLNFMKEFYKNKGCMNMIIWTLNGLKNNAFYKRQGGIIEEEKEYEYGNIKYPGIGYGFKL